MSNVLSFLPSLGMTGFYSLAAPYDKLISLSSHYRCDGVRTLASAQAEGLDPLNEVYLANGDTKDKYDLDLQASVSLITISNSTGTILSFPSSALLSVPSGDGVVYRNTVLSVALSALPEDQDLTLLQSEVIELVLFKYGLKAATFITTVGAPAVLTQTQHEAVLSARAAAVQTQVSLIAENNRLTLDLANAVAKIALLETFVKAQL